MSHLPNRKVPIERLQRLREPVRRPGRGREEEQKRYFPEQRLYTLQIESTDACPQGCLYCYAGSSLAERDR